jgi:excisionase family DNA binding protein
MASELTAIPYEMSLLIQGTELKELLKQELQPLLEEIRSLRNAGTKPSRNLNAKEAAAYFGISLSTLYKSLNRIPHKRFGKKLLFSQKELDELRH